MKDGEMVKLHQKESIDVTEKLYSTPKNA